MCDSCLQVHVVIDEKGQMAHRSDFHIPYPFNIVIEVDGEVRGWEEGRRSRI